MLQTIKTLGDHVKAKLNDADVDFDYGQAALAVQAQPKRVVWVANGGRVEPSTRRGPIIHPEHPELVIHPLYDFVLRVTATISSDHSLDVLWGRVLSATRDTFGANSVPASFDIDTQAEKASAGRPGFERLRQEFEWRLMLSRATTRRQGSVFVTENVVLTIQDFSFSLEEVLT